ncbi:MAG: lysophospholipid acyltransferase family protein [Methylacidiphilales bacterium]|nr:lysophospholipid acyltransferase family protein [Candidatus Methylacidiphilales bacterium]MDW8348803.1 lysophospholipid acyltransferase family protein [Verrucomicrobiae bacterium]
MIRATPSWWGRHILRPFFEWHLRRHFHAAYFWGWESWKRIADDEPILAYANHSSWWDAIVLIHLIPFFKPRQSYCMMERLEDYPFFRHLGAYSVSLSRPVEAAVSLRYTSRLIGSRHALVWIFPQGRILPPHSSFEVREGFRWLIRRHPHAALLPLGLRYGFAEHERPIIAGAFGEPLRGEDRERLCVERLEQLLRMLDQRVGVWDWSGARVTLRPGLSLHERWDRWRGRLFFWSGRQSRAEK